MAWIPPTNGNPHIVVATACQDCDRQAVMVFYGYPGDSDVKLVVDSIGGMNCIATKIFKQVEDDYHWKEIE